MSQARISGRELRSALIHEGVHALDVGGVKGSGRFAEASSPTGPQVDDLRGHGPQAGRAARTAARASRAVSRSIETEISFDGEEADPTSAMLVMALGTEKGAEVTVSGDNPDAVDEIAALIEQDLDEE